MRAAYNGHVETLEALRGHGADLHERRYCASLAASRGHQGCVKVLLDQALNIEQESMGRCTPLVKAAANGYTGVARLLLSRGADPEEGDFISVAEGNEEDHAAEALGAHFRTMQSQRRQQLMGHRS